MEERKKVVILSLTESYDQRLDAIAAELAGDVGRPNRSAVVKALIDDYSRDRVVRKLRRKRRGDSATAA
jgi:hypothetical protein